MNPVFVHDIETKGKKGLEPPGAGAYEPFKTFGDTGFKKTMSPNLNFDSYPLRKQRQLPGPGQYVVQNVLSQGIASSRVLNQHG